MNTVDILPIRTEAIRLANETGQRVGQAFFNYMLTKEQQRYVIQRQEVDSEYAALYHISSKTSFTVWLLVNVIDVDPITLRY